MGKKLELTKENNKSRVYENDEYIVCSKDVQGGYYLKNGDKRNPCWEPGKPDDELVYINTAVTLEVKSKKTGKKAQKRCYQGESAVDDLQDALDGKSGAFLDVLKKIND